MACRRSTSTAASASRRLPATDAGSSSSVLLRAHQPCSDRLVTSREPGRERDGSMSRRSDEDGAGRRRFLGAAGAAAAIATAATAFWPALVRARPARAGKGAHEEAEGTPGEDLMQEHGVLERILLVYDEAARRIERGEAVDLAVVTEGAGVVRRFVEEYHEQLEEQFVFPRLETAKREVELVAVLRLQHR